MWNSESREISSIFPLRALPKVKIIDQPCCLNIKGVNVDFLPYTKNPKECVENNFKEKSDVLFGHLAIDGAYLNTFYNTVSEVSVEYEGDMVKVDVGVFNGWKKVLLGHYHGAQKVNEIVEYIGSPLQLNFNEVFQKKHIIAMDLDNLFCEYIENTFSPRHLIVKESEIGNYKLKGNFVRIESDNLSSSKIIDIKNSLSGVVSTLEFKEIKSNKHNELKTDLDKAKKILSEGEIVEKYISLVETSLEKEKLMLIGRQIIQKGTSS
jgi:DNA repair exonuclease SbcCD nuclease subunit